MTARLKLASSRMAGAGAQQSAYTRLPAPLDDAQGLWRFESVPDGWTAAAGWLNDGTGGPPLDLSVSSEADAQVLSPVETANDDNRVTPTKAGAGFTIGFGLGDADNGGSDYGFFGANGLNMAGSFTFVLDYTPLGTTLTSMRYLRKGGPFLYPGLIIEEVVPMFGGFIIEALGPNVTVSPLGGFVVHSGSPVAGRQVLAIVVNRTTHVASFYRDGAAIAASLADESGMGDSTTAYPLVVGPGQTVHNVGFWPRALTAAEVALVSGYWGD